MISAAVRTVGFVAAVTLSAGPAAYAAEPPSPGVTTPPAREQFVVVPLRIHILTSADLPEADCRLSDADVARILRKVNGIWHNAGIHWGLESLVREPAADTAKFRLARGLDSRVSLGIFSILIPESSRTLDAFHVYYLHKFPVNGVCMGPDFAMVQETARLNEVPGGIDEPVPRVTAHELGHALGLRHRQDRTNLLASGTTGTLLNSDEVATARRFAQRRKGAVTVPELTTRAEAEAREGRFDSAIRLWRWLSEIPGQGSDEASRTLSRLEEARAARRENGEK